MLEVFILSSILSCLCTYFLIPLLRKFCMDNPNQRSSHVKATPRGGGLAFVLVGTLLNLLYAPESIRWIPIICLPLALIGLIDDMRGLTAFFRYSIQIITGIVLVINANLTISNGISILFILLITALINFVNFMDGLDGLVAGCGVLLLASTSSWAIAGAIFGFLIWNWSPAKIFMGDVGSTFIGAIFGGLLIHTDSYYESLGILLIGFPLFADAFFCLVRRCMQRENIFQAHRKHLFQRLHQAGWTHRDVATLYISGVAILFVSKLLTGLPGLLICVSIEFIYGLYLDNYVAKEFQRA